MKAFPELRVSGEKHIRRSVYLFSRPVIAIEEHFNLLWIGLGMERRLTGAAQYCIL